MSYSKSILGKNIFNLTYADIETFFQSEREENLNLEFKAYVAKGGQPEKEKVIKKSVCALLNSEGGIIIWGAPVETRDSDGNTKASGDLTPFNIGLDKDKLINILSSSIIPMPIGVYVNFLDNGAGSFVVIIEVAKSIERPHQYDNRYFIRLDGQTRVAPHYFIKALITSQDFPIIRGHVKLKKISITGSNIFATFRYVLFNTSQLNNEKNVFLRILVNLGNINYNGQSIGNNYRENFALLSHGQPIMSNLVVKVGMQELQDNLKILLQFGGEKSPSKISSYEYNLNAYLVDGDVADESIYIVEKTENSLPSDVSDNTDDDNINQLLNI